MSESVCGRSSVYRFNVTPCHLLVSDAGLFRITPTGHTGLRCTPATGVAASAPVRPPWGLRLNGGGDGPVRCPWAAGHTEAAGLFIFPTSVWGSPFVPCVQDAGSFIPPPEGAPSLALGRGSAEAAGQRGPELRPGPAGASAGGGPGVRHFHGRTHLAAWTPLPVTLRTLFQSDF